MGLKACFYCTDIIEMEALIGDLKLCLAYRDMSIQHGTNHSAIEEWASRKSQNYKEYDSKDLGLS